LVGLCWCAPSCVPSCLRSCVRFVVCSRVSCPGLRFEEDLHMVNYLTNTIAASAAPARFPTSFDGLLTSIGGHSPGRHLGLLRVPSILRPLLRPTPRDAAVAGGAHGRGLPARRSCVRLHLRRRRAEPSACRRYALMRSISSRRSVWFTLNSSSGVAARRNAAPSHECADEASPAFPCVCRRGG
jgi:hypothetical protein